VARERRRVRASRRGVKVRAAPVENLGMRRTAVMRARRGATLAAALLAVSIVAGTSAASAAAPRAPRFGPVIEDYAGYEAPVKCRPAAKPGVRAFADLLEDTYPDTAWIGIERECHRDATSDHQEGRALDWSRDASDRSHRSDVKDLFEWLFAEDRHGNTDAIARRLGITYLIWNRRIWGSWSGSWGVYCVQKPAGCRDPESRSILNPHTDHVHISFGWPGARMQTTFWNPKDSFED
jgi:hypothetical protein